MSRRPVPGTPARPGCPPRPPRTAGRAGRRRRPGASGRGPVQGGGPGHRPGGAGASGSSGTSTTGWTTPAGSRSTRERLDAGASTAPVLRTVADRVTVAPASGTAGRTAQVLLSDDEIRERRQRSRSPSPAATARRGCRRRRRPRAVSSLSPDQERHVRDLNSPGGVIRTACPSSTVAIRPEPFQTRDSHQLVQHLEHRHLARWPGRARRRDDSPADRRSGNRPATTGEARGPPRPSSTARRSPRPDRRARADPSRRCTPS